MPNFSQCLAYPSIDFWIIKVFIVIFCSLLLSLISRLVLNRFAVKAAKTVNPWDDALINSVGTPLRLLIWVVGLTIAMEIIQTDTKNVFIDNVDPFRDISIVVTIAWFLIRFIKNFQHTLVVTKMEQGGHIDRTGVEAIVKLLRLAIMITASLIILQTIGVSITGVLTFGGVGGIATGFAAKDLLSNFFGGLMIYLDRPFSVDDWVCSPDRSIEGTVEYIGWRMTRIRTFKSRPLYVPNSTFSTIAIENPSRMTNRQIYEIIGIRYEDAGVMKNIVSDITEYLKKHDDIDQDKSLMVNFTKFADSSMDFFIYCFTKTTKWAEYNQIKQMVLLHALEVIESHGAECAFPTSTLHINMGQPESL